jgi:hypothetical protein
MKFLKQIIWKIMGRDHLGLPYEFEIVDPYNLPVHDQGDKNNCTSHAFAGMMEIKLSHKLKERTLIDVDDLWEKQKKFGTATEDGDFMEGPFIIATKYGVRFKTDSGRTGIFYLSGENIQEGNMTTYLGWKIELDP